ncbi:HK97 family phage prohead protease [bacterium]|nr:HK97 family phage prohead protease [bacterium]
MQIETRALDLRAATVEGNTITGIAVPYNSSSSLLRDRPRPYRERFVRGAFDNIGDHVSLFVGHDHRSLPLARVGAGTLSFIESDEGLLFEAKLPEAREDVLEAVRRGDIGGVSIGFNSITDQWTHRRGETPSSRVVTRAELFECSLVPAGAYPAAVIH